MEGRRAELVVLAGTKTVYRPRARTPRVVLARDQVRGRSCCALRVEPELPLSLSGSLDVVRDRCPWEAGRPVFRERRLELWVLAAPAKFETETKCRTPLGMDRNRPSLVPREMRIEA